MKKQALEILREQNISEVSLIYKRKTPQSDAPLVSSSFQCQSIFSKYWNPDTIELFEEFAVMLLNRANRILGLIKISAGGTSGTFVDIKLIMQSAILSNASGIIVAHNHPSGNLKPSDADIKLTKKIASAASLFDMSLIDHVILSAQGYYSFADEGQL